MNDATVTNPFLYLQRNAAANPSGAFFETVNQTVLNADALVSAQKIAYELRQLGVKPGDLVALDLPETLSLIFTEAVFHEAAVSTVLPRGYESDGAFPIEWIFSSATTPPASQAGAQVISVDDTFIRRVEQNPTDISPREYASAQSTGRLLFSSGTTGQPNAIEFSLALLEFLTTDALDTYMDGDPFLVFLPTGTTMGFFGFYVSAKDGRPFWSVESGKPEAIVQLALRSSATSLMGSPAQMAGLVDVLEARGQTLPDVRTVHIAGTVMPPALAARLRTATGGCAVYNLYGSTETTLATARYYESEDPFDAGHPVEGSRLQIVDEDDVELPAGQIGRIRHNTAHMVHEYLGNPEATRAVFKDEWFYPGDLGLIRPDGGLTLAGRASEVLNAGGVKIDPTQLDLFAVTHPLVIDAASFEYVTSSGVKQIGIALVTEDGLNVQALIRDFDAKFGSAAPKLLARMEEIPRNAMGKPMRLTLAEQHKES
ncbi:long-chain fatty acid--CoA ligase [Leifsonia kafniensis]|uniref:Long-chain fatty acid--CoA ligase n=1 Tax=Leifsonia kafniensis TaxID=475957 RepID=A0ABP7KUC1_9MICO